MSKNIPIEDLYEDVVSKAQRGLGISSTDLAEQIAEDQEVVRAARRGQFVEAHARKMAEVLSLNPDALVKLGQNAYYPEIPEVDGFQSFNTPYEGLYPGMTVNAYLLWDPDSRKAVAFDTGANVKEMKSEIASRELELEALFITHAHPDHIAAIDDLVGPDVALYASPLSSVKDKTDLVDGETYSIGALTIKPALTPGHSLDGTSFVVGGLSRPIAVVGDALFASSVGGIPPELYADALEAIRVELLSLSGETLLCPGHGPVTTVDQEKLNNPFFA